MKAQPCKLIPGEGYVKCSLEECTHVTLNIPGPTAQLTLPVILKGKREGTGCWTWNGDIDKPTFNPCFEKPKSIVVFIDLFEDSLHRQKLVCEALGRRPSTASS